MHHSTPIGMEIPARSFPRFLQLPSEIQEMVAAHLSSMAALCAFRASGREAKKVAWRSFGYIFRDLRHVITYHSLQALVDITAHPDLSPFVRQIHICSLRLTPHCGFDRLIRRHDPEYLENQRYRAQVTEVDNLFAGQGSPVLLRFLTSAFLNIVPYKNAITVGVCNNRKCCFGARKLRFSSRLNRLCECVENHRPAAVILKLILNAAMSTNCTIVGVSIQDMNLQDLDREFCLDRGLETIMAAYPGLKIVLEGLIEISDGLWPQISFNPANRELHLQGITDAVATPPYYQGLGSLVKGVSTKALTVIHGKRFESLIIRSAALDGKALCEKLIRSAGTARSIILDGVVLCGDDWRRVLTVIDTHLSWLEFLCIIPQLKYPAVHTDQAVLENFGLCAWEGKDAIRNGLQNILASMAANDKIDHGENHYWTTETEEE